jgi:uncharacterized membrane protein
MLSLICLLNFLFAFTFIIWTGSRQFQFLFWNLFLAFIPYGLSTLLHVKSKWNKSVQFALLLAWLAFLPNAPYIITDFCHLPHDFTMYMWFSLLLLTVFSATGLIMMMISIYDVHSYLRDRFTEKISWSIIAITCFASGLGIYVGRFLRWNSWDLITRPGSLMLEGEQHFAQAPDAFYRLGFVIVFGLLLFAAYTFCWYLFRVFARKELIAEYREKIQTTY